MNAVENMNLSWNEKTEKCLKGVRKNIWTDLSKGGDTGHCVDLNEIVELVKQTSLDEINVEDVKEIVQKTAASLSNYENKELEDQEEHKNIESSDFEEEQKELSTAFSKTSLTITEIMDQFIENGPNFNSSKARQGVMDALSTYQQLLTEHKRKMQITFNTFLIKKQKIGNTKRLNDLKSIYLGHFRNFREGIRVTPFMMTMSELRSIDRCGVTPQHLLYMAMKIMQLRVRDSLTVACEF
ncbi:uncharacterized protein TNCT_730271 [Trichonephila clavata]|uniref:Uncharacterized protein n=1 Tax=Trichonephila clavata TaxID=2740835 RepID=A0A8X6JPU3_TRICU|nr:uncharacterized protein TNCT_730271 [Trichonephila clavata]